MNEFPESFSELDLRFAALLHKLDGRNDPAVETAAARLSHRLAEGHVYLDVGGETGPNGCAWESSLRTSPVVGAPEDRRPLILTPSGKLYLQRYWQYESVLARQLRQRADYAEVLPLALETRLDNLFGEAAEQKEAARNALRHRISVISGGPGTGKTTTVLKILLLLGQQAAPKALRIHLAAPTGKAAARLQAGIDEGRKTLADQINEIPALPQVASTIHRMLGALPGSVQFRHHAHNPLLADVVVIDEASMIDLPLMAKLMEALPLHCRVIILGDKDQLASVETGYVLGGIVEAASNEQGPLSNLVTTLTRNYRFGNDSGLFRLCEAVRRGDREETLALLRQPSPGLEWHPLPSPSELKECLRPLVTAGYSNFLSQNDPAEALAALGQFQILTPVRRGWFGREGLNQLTEEILREEGLLSSNSPDWAGRPLLVTENDHTLRLYNGDTGILLPASSENPTLMAWFPDGPGKMRMISPLRLPAVETAFAITVHKSQGCEYDHVLLVLPDSSGRLLSRELLYTGLSQARKTATLWAAEEVASAAVCRRTERASGMADMLRETD